MAKYKIPGVYVEETPSVSLLKSSPATALFIGYTEKHQNTGGENLYLIPTEINSLLDFETIFGTAQPEKHIKIFDDSTAILENIIVKFEGVRSLHNLYYSIKSFFDQGGNSCQIVSVGTFKDLGEPIKIQDFLSGLDSLDQKNSNYLISIPESQNLVEHDFYILQEKILEYCAEEFSFAVLDLPKVQNNNVRNVIDDYRQKLFSSHLHFGSVFFPNLITTYPYHYDDSLVNIKKLNIEFSLLSLKENNSILYTKYQRHLRNFGVEIPPSPAVVGAFLTNDKVRGIWKAPANIELNQIQKPIISLSKEDQEFLNFDPIDGKSINAVRNFPDKGTLIWGSRTLAGNDVEEKYISVRRFANLLKNDLENSLKQFLLRENSPEIWVIIRNMTENYLMHFWKLGAFQGEKPEKAFYVKCGLHQTMTEKDLIEGNLIIEIGVAMIRPAEFIVLKIQAKMNK